MYSFAEILGNEHIKDNLQKAIDAGRISHAFIFSGAAGTGKKRIAYTFAKALNCTGGEPASCGHCTSCITFESGNNPDIISVHPKGKSIGIDEVREQITEKMELKPYSGKYKIFVVEEADKLTVAAQNALLKTMEEPASYGIFLLTCENYNTFLPTIISRAVIQSVHPLPVEVVADYLTENRGIEKRESEMFAAYSEGSIGKASLLAEDTEFQKLRGRFLELAANAELGDAFDALSAAEEMAAYKDKAQDGLDVLSIRYRDALVYKSTGRADLLVESYIAGEIRNHTENRTLSQLTKRIQAIIKAKKALAQNANMRLVFEVMLLGFAD